MSIKAKISIKEFDSKSYQSRLTEPTIEEEKAILTHYLHNIYNGVSKHYSKEAKKVLENFIEYKQENNISIVSEDVIQQFLFEVEKVPFPTPENYTFKFIDLFAGVGGFRIAMQNMGGKCVYTSEWNQDAKITYRENFGEVPFGDITKASVKEFIPQNSIFCVQDFLAKLFPLPDIKKDFQTQEEHCFLT